MTSPSRRCASAAGLPGSTSFTTTPAPCGAAASEGKSGIRPGMALATGLSEAAR